MDIARDVRVIRFLPAYFSAISHLLALLSQDEPSIPQIVQAVGSDQSLTSRLLNVVNSPYYGSVRQIGTIDEAVVRIGIIGLRNLTLAVSMNDITGGVKQDEWKHSLITAHTTDILARKKGAPLETQRYAFVAGLLHDIGKLFLSRRYALEYHTVLSRTRSGQTLSEAERGVFGYDHAQVGGMLLEVWNVPQKIVEAIQTHHAPGQNQLANLVCFSDQIIHWAELPPGKKTDVEIAGFSREEIEWIYSDASAKAHDMETRIH
jgi:putative nucleotidyltransferase with HDIG domain